jgi:hypothetical protein
VKDKQGYIIPAVNSADTDYVACAITLAKSLRHWHPNVKICLLTDQPIDHPLFDYVQILPYGDQGGWANDWQVFTASPFHETIKLEADTIVTSPIDHWWTMFRHRDVCFSIGCLDYQDQESNNRTYRRVFDANNLLDVYNAVTYWRFSREAKEFFDTVRNIFTNWDQYVSQLKQAQNEPASTDLVYAIAAELLGREKFYIPNATYPKIVHMKPAILGIQASDWTKELVWELVNGEFRLNGHSQHGLVHYHQKHLAQEFYDRYTD